MFISILDVLVNELLTVNTTFQTIQAHSQRKLSLSKQVAKDSRTIFKAAKMERQTLT